MSVKQQLAEAVAALPETASVEEAFYLLHRALQAGRERAALGAAAGFGDLSDVLEFLAALPAPQEILALRPSPALQERLRVLLDKSRDQGLSHEELAEWARYEYVEHLVRLAKARAAEEKLRVNSQDEGLRVLHEQREKAERDALAWEQDHLLGSSL